MALLNLKGKTPSVWVVSLAATLATFMSSLDLSVANVSLPRIAMDLKTSIPATVPILSTYFISSTIAIPLSGWLIMLLGRKRYYTLCVLGFTLFSLFCGLAPTVQALVIFRLLQGLAGGGLSPTAQAIMIDSYPQEKQGSAMAFFGVVGMAAVALGPPLGGWITDHYTWRWIFFINVPVGLVALLLIHYFISDPPYLTRKTIGKGMKLDYLGFILLVAGVGSSQLFLQRGQKISGLTSGGMMFWVVVTVLILAVCAWWESRQEEPVVNVRLLKEQNFGFGDGLQFLFFFIWTSSTFLYPLFFETLLKYPALESGLIISPGAIVSLVMLPVAGWLCTKFDHRLLICTGLLMGAVSFALMGLHIEKIGYLSATMFRIIQAAGSPLVFVPMNVLTFAYVPKERRSQATSFVRMINSFGSSIGIVFFVAYLSARLHSPQPNAPYLAFSQAFLIMSAVFLSAIIPAILMKPPLKAKKA